MKHIKLLEITFLIFVLMLGTLPWYTVVRGASTQKRIANQVVRLHVLANSDSSRDQDLKLKVKQKTVIYLQKELSGVCSKDEAIEKIHSLFPQLEKIAKEVLAENNCSDTVEISIEDTEFPEKTYGDLTFPAGNYTALKISIGSGTGHNWWCILFPSLCYVDESISVVPDSSKEKLKGSLSQKDYESLLKDKNTEVEYRFFLLDWLKGL